MENREIEVVIEMKNGMRMIVGRDMGENERFRDMIRKQMVMEIGIMGVGEILIWILVGRREIKRIEDVQREQKRIMDGDMKGRIKVKGQGEELERMYGNINVMMVRIMELKEGMKKV